MINSIKVIYEFTNTDTKTTNGVYEVYLNNKQHIFIRNDKSVGVVQHYLGRAASDCVSIIRDDVKQEFFSKLCAGG